MVCQGYLSSNVEVQHGEAPDEEVQHVRKKCGIEKHV